MGPTNREFSRAMVRAIRFAKRLLRDREFEVWRNYPLDVTPRLQGLMLAAQQTFVCAAGYLRSVTDVNAFSRNACFGLSYEEIVRIAEDGTAEYIPLPQVPDPWRTL